MMQAAIEELCRLYFLSSKLNNICVPFGDVFNKQNEKTSVDLWKTSLAIYLHHPTVYLEKKGFKTMHV